MVGVGGSASNWENGKGVYIRLRSKAEGAELSLGADVATIEFAK